MADVFISYSRKDTDFVRQLYAVLQAHQRQAWVDWQSITYSTRWWDEICAGIEGADHFVFIVSPDSLKSVHCHREIEHAYRFKKRIIPLVYRAVDEAETVGHWYTDSDMKPIEPLARQNWEILKSIQWIDYPQHGDLEQSLNELVQTIDTDPERVRAHTRLLLRVRDWEGRGRSPSALLRGEELVAYEEWLKQSTTTNARPQPTEGQQDYVAESRRFEDEAKAAERQRATEDEKRIAALQRATDFAARTRQQLLGTISFAAVVIVVALGAAWLSFQGQRSAAERAAQANTEVAVAGQALTPIPVTLTSVAQRVLDGEATLKVVSQQLTAIPPTTTQLAVQLGAVSTELAKNGVFICPGASRAVFTQVKVGNFGRVTISSGATRLNIRLEPSASAEIVGQIPDGSIIQILDGPVCGKSGNLTVAWWKVQFGEITGWSAEALDTADRFIEPVGASPTPSP